MNSQKGFVIPLIITIIAILAIGGGYSLIKIKPCAWLHVGYRNIETKLCENFSSCSNVPKKYVLDNTCLATSTATTTTPIIGGDKDEHGCLGPAGYSWCAVKNKCLRVWEEKCEVVATTTNPVACTMDAMMCPDGTYVGRSAPDCKFICPVTGENSFCGGIAGVKCALGLTCKYDGTYPDAGGKCIK